VNAYVAETPEDLSAWGLDRPELSMTLSLGPEAARKTLHIGDPGGDGRYARDVSRKPVFLIPDDLFQELNVDLSDLRDKAVLDFPRDRVAELELRRDGTTIVCRRDSSGGWILAAPESAPADHREVEAVINALDGLEAEEFIEQEPADLGRYGLAEPRHEAILRDESGATIAWLRLGRETDEGIYASDADSSPVVRVARTILTALSPELTDLKRMEAATP
jgi:hypothetical protein